jgi:hypothetical protein
MKKHSAGAKRRRAQAPAGSVNELLTRMKMNPENFIFGEFIPSEDEGTGFMCIACAMPASFPGPSTCCGVPVIVVDD